MFHEVESGTDTWQPHDDVRLFERVEAALNVPLPGWPPPAEFMAGEDTAQDWRNDLGPPPAWVRAALAAPLPEGAPQGLLRVVSGLRRRITIAADVEDDGETWERLCILAAEAARLRLASPALDNASQELVDLARQGDAAGFRALAACVMPVEEIGECWAGARRRLGLPA